MLMPRFLLLIVGLVVVGRASVARAVPVPILEWEAPIECPDSRAVLQSLSELIDETSRAAARKPLVRGHVRANGSGGWMLSLEMIDAEKSRLRTLTAQHCEDLANAAAVAIALLLGDDANGGSAQDAQSASGTHADTTPPTLAPSSLGRERETPSAPQLNPRVVANDGRADDRSREDDYGRRSALGGERGLDAVRWGAEGLWDFSTLARASAGISVEGRAEFGALAVGLYGLLLIPSQTAVRSDEYVEFALRGGGLRGCYRWLEQPLRADGCLGFEAGELVARGSGLASSRQVRDGFFAPSAGIALAVPLIASLSLRSRVEELFPLVRKNYVVNETERVHQTPSVAFRLSLGLEWAWQL